MDVPQLELRNKEKQNLFLSSSCGIPIGVTTSP